VEDAGTGVQTEGRDESEVTEAVRGQLGYRGPQPNLSRLSTLFPWTPDDVGPGAVRSRGHVNAIHKPYPSSSSSSSFSLLPPAAAGRRVALAPLKPLSRLPFLRPYPAAADVADGVDKVFLASMHYLRTFPWVRLSLLAYLFLLHIYVFSVVGWQAGRIETIHSDTGGSFLEPSNRAFVKDVASTNGGNGV